MTRSGSRRGRNSAERYKWIGHIPVYFNDSELQQVISFVDERKWDFEDVVSRIAQAGYGIKFKFDASNDCYHCTLQPTSTNCYLRGYTLGFNHVDLVRLLGVASYVVEVLVEQGSIVIPETTSVNSF